MKRKSLAILLALAVTASLAACGSGSGEAQNTAEASTATDSSAADGAAASSEEGTAEEAAETEEATGSSVLPSEPYTYEKDGDTVLTDEVKMIFRNNIIKDLARNGIDETSFDKEEWLVINTQYTYADELCRASLMYYDAALGEYASEQFTEEFKQRWIDEQEMAIFDMYTSWDEIIAESVCLTWAQLFDYPADGELAVLNYLMECNDASGSSDSRPAYFFNAYDGYSEADLKMIEEDPLPTYETSKQNQESVQREREILAELKAILEE